MVLLLLKVKVVEEDMEENMVEEVEMAGAARSGERGIFLLIN